jgi:hypothetical protein
MTEDEKSSKPQKPEGFGQSCLKAVSNFDFSQSCLETAWDFLINLIILFFAGFFLLVVYAMVRGLLFGF